MKKLKNMKNFLKKIDLHQHTLKKEISFCGVGLHSRKQVHLTIKPAEPNTGIRFVRTDRDNAEIPAFMDYVVDTSLATTLASNDGAVVSTVEHLLGALVGLGVDNALIALDGDEVPIMDGSAGPFVHLLKKCGRQRQKAGKQMLKITRELSFSDGNKTIRVKPYEGMKYTYEIDFDHDLIRHQLYTMAFNPKKFADEIASARTFGFMHEVEMLKSNGYALGGSLDNAVVIDRLGILNEEGLRYADEFVRHKVLDLMGDMALLGFPVIGHFIASKAGHGQHLGLMKEIANHPECWEFVKFEKHGDSVLERVVTSTVAASNKILPYLVPTAAAPMAQESY